MQEIYLCKYVGSSGERVGSMNGDRLYDLNLCAVTQLSEDYGIKDAYRLANRLVPADLQTFLGAGDSALSAARRGLQWVIESGDSEGPTGEAIHFDRNHVTLKAPIVPDTKVICMGDTYVSHAELAGAEQPDSPGIFFKMSGVVVGPDEFVVYPKNYHPKPLVYDTEMTVVIGKDGMSIAEDDVDDHIWGYTVLNDLTLRGVKDMGPRYKCFESSAPVGPWIVPKDQIEDRYNLDLTFRINGKVVQTGNTSNLVFTIPRMLSEVSEYHALRTGDIICTGGPGATETIQVGDIIEAEVEGIGTLRNPVKLED